MHGHISRRDLFQHVFGGALAGAPLLDIGFFRATWARAQSVAATGQLFNIQNVTEGVYAALAHPAAITNCNAAIFVNSQYVVVVDAHSKPSAAASLIAQIKKEVTTKPVRYLVNTHFHYDHSQGDAAYKATGNKVEIIASETTKQLIAQNARQRLKDQLNGIPKLLGELRERIEKTSSPPQKEFLKDQIRQLEAYQVEMKSFTPEMPDISFAQSYAIKDSAQDLHIEFHGRAHTAGDVVVFSPQKRVVATGDMISGFLPAMGDGYPREWPRTINSVDQLAADQMLPGHGLVQPNHDRMIHLRNYIEDLTERVAAGKKAGMPLADLQKKITVSSLKTLQSNGYANYVAENLKNFSVYLGSRTALEDRLSANIEAIYNNLDRA